MTAPGPPLSPAVVRQRMIRVIATTENAEFAADRCLDVVVEYLRGQGRQMRDCGDMFAEGAAVAGLADELECC